METTIALPAEDPAAAAFVMEGDEMAPVLPAGRTARLVFELPAQGECGLFAVDGRAYVRQYCEDSFGTIYLLCVNRARADQDLVFPKSAGKTVVCLGRVPLEKTPPLPFA